jgi:hypothetical protein
MKTMHLITQSLFAILLLTLASGCGTTFSQVSVQQSALTGGQVLPHRAVLVLNHELADYKHKFVLVGGTDVYPIGDALQAYATNVGSKSFQQIDIASSEGKAASFPSDDLILIPRVIKSDTTYSVIGFGHTRFFITLVMEWTVKNRASGNIVWLKTFIGKASTDAGTFDVLKQRRILFQNVFDDLSPKTYNAFQEAPELRGSQP